MATGPGRTTRPGRVRRAAVRRADCDRRGARPCLIGGLVDCRSHRRCESGIGLWHLRYMRSGYIPRERENYPYQYGADGRGEPRPTAAAGEPSWSRLSTHAILPSHGNAAYQRAEATRAGVIRRLFFHLVVVDPAGKAERSAESRLRPGRPPRPRWRAPQPWRSGRNPEKRSFRPNGHGPCPGTGTESRLEYPLCPKSLPASDVYLQPCCVRHPDLPDFLSKKLSLRANHLPCRRVLPYRLGYGQYCK